MHAGEHAFAYSNKTESRHLCTYHFNLLSSMLLYLNNILGMLKKTDQNRLIPRPSELISMVINPDDLGTRLRSEQSKGHIWV